MDTSRLVAVAAVVAAVGITVVAPAAAFAPAGPLPQAGANGTADDGADDRRTNGSFGTQVTSFMQASAASANNSVESGVWRASVNRSAQPEQAVERRTTTLDRRLDRLQNRSEELAALRERGEIPEVAYTARASTLRAQAASLRTAVTEANEAARQVGVNTTRLDRLRDRAANATGPEVAAPARNITDVGGGPPGAGPHGGTPPQAGPQGNGTGGPPGDETRGPPGSAGNATESGNGTDGSGDGPTDDRSGGQDDTDTGNAGNSGGSGGPGDTQGTTADVVSVTSVPSR